MEIESGHAMRNVIIVWDLTQTRIELIDLKGNVSPPVYETKQITETNKLIFDNKKQLNSWKGISYTVSMGVSPYYSSSKRKKKEKSYL